MRRAAPNPGPLRRALVLGPLTLLVLLVVQAVSALGATQVYTGHSSGPTPDIERTGVTVILPDGAAVGPTAVGTIHFTVDGVARVGYCVDPLHRLSEGTETVAVTTSDAPADRAVAWILLNRTPSGAPTPERTAQAATAQVAVLLLRGQARASGPTDDPALNAAAGALADEALAATATPATLAVSAPAAAAGPVDVVVTGRSGTPVHLATDPAGATLSASDVVLGPDGRAVVTVTAPAGTVTVTATAPGDAVLQQVVPARAVQATVFATPVTLTARATTTVAAAATTGGPAPTVTTPTPSGGTPLGVVTAGRAPRLTITKVGPRTAVGGRIVGYVIRVTNRGDAPARDVRVTDRIPSGLVIAGRTSATLRRGTATWRVGTLAPGASRTVTIALRAAAGFAGTRSNTATATATGVGPVQARATTTFASTRPRIQPAVTG